MTKQLNGINEDTVVDIAWDLETVRIAIDLHDIGDFSQSGKLADSVLKDDEVKTCVDTLTFGILGLPFEWKWQEEVVTSKSTDVFTPTPQDLNCLEITKKMWVKIMASTVPSLLMKQIINMGFSIISRNWELEYIDGHDEKLYVPNLYIFHPSNTFYVSGMYQYGVNTYNRGTIFIDEEGDERFQIVKHVDGQRPWMQGAVRSVGFSWIDKTIALTKERGHTELREFIDYVNNEIKLCYLGFTQQLYVKAYATTINMAMQKLVADFYKFNFPNNVKVPIPCFNLESLVTP